MSTLKRLHTAIGTLKSLFYNVSKEDFATCGEDVILEYPVKVDHPELVYIGSHVVIRGGLTLISHTGKLIIKDHTRMAQRLTVVTGNHTVKPPLDRWQVECNQSGYGDIEEDVTIEEDVWIGINVTIMPGVTIGRGSIIGACSNVTKSTPPYTVCCGNPCRVVRLKYSIEEIIKREEILYPSDKRLDKDFLYELLSKYIHNEV